MPQIINTNIASLNSQRNLNRSQNELGVSLQRLSSGLRINSARDDAAGLAISERFTTQIRGLNQAARNANDGISLAQTAEGDLAQITNNLQRIRELAVQSANATNSSSDRAALQLEADQLIAEIQRVADTSAFNGVKLLDGTFASQQFQVGANAGETVSITQIDSAQTDTLGQNSVATFTGGTTITANGLAAGDLIINGVDVASGGAVAADAAAIASAITSQSNFTTATATNTQALAFTQVSGSPAVPTSISLGAFTSVVAEGTGGSTASFQIDGQVITSGASSTDNADLITGAQIDGALSALDAGDGSADGNITINGNVYSYTGTAASGGADLVISRADGADFDITLTSNNGSDTNGFLNLLETADTVTVTGGTPAVALDYTLTLDTVGVDLSGVNSDGTITLAELAGVINGLGGFTATAGAGVINITKDDGSNFTLTEGGTDAATEGFAVASATYRGLISNLTTTGQDLVITGANESYAGLPDDSTTTAVITAGTGVSSIDISTVNGANAALGIADRALDAINSSRAALGAIQNRFDSIVSSIQTSSENLSAARSRIRDADFAAETAALTRSQILQQAGVAVLSQANALPQLALSLLQ